MGKQKPKHWAHLVIHRARHLAIVLGNRRAVSEMSTKERAAYEATLNPETVARRERREARRAAASGVMAAPAKVASRPTLAVSSEAKGREMAQAQVERKGVLNRVANLGRKLFGPGAS